MYEKQRKSWRRYWIAYGGKKSLVESPYFHFAILITAIGIPFWLRPEWWELPIGILPDLLGFTLGGLAVFLGLLSQRTLKLLTNEKDKPDQWLGTRIVASYLHFVICQALALILALLAKILFYPSPSEWLNWARVPLVIVFWGAGFFFFIYAVLLTIPTAFSLLAIARMILGEAVSADSSENEASNCLKDAIDNQNEELNKDSSN